MSDDNRADSAIMLATSGLAKAVPALRPILSEHTAYHGEVVPVVAWAAFRHALVDFVESGDEFAVTTFLEVVERLAGGSEEEVRTLVGVVLLEDGMLLSGGRERAALTRLEPRLGPATRALLSEIKQHYDGLARRDA